MFEIGSSLRDERERLRLTLADIEDATRIRERYLDAIEREWFDELPSGAYRRSFVREYADFLGLDGDTYADEYELRFAPPEPELPASPRRGPGRRRAAIAGGSLLVAVLVGVAVWLLSRGGGPAALPPAVTTGAPAPHRTRTSHVLSERKTTRPAGPIVVTAARGSCWLSVHAGSANGATVYEQTLQQGGSVRFGLRTRLYIRFGAPWNVDVTIAGRSVTGQLPSKTGDVVATAAGLKAAG